MNKGIAVAIAVVVLITGGIAGFAIGRTTGGDHGGTMASGVSMGHDDDDMGGMSEGANGMTAMDEQQFLAMMIPHHQMAVDMAKAELGSGTNPKVKAIARRVIAAQDKEIAQMTAWYRDWYGTDPPKESETEMAEMAEMMGMSPGSMDGTAIATASNPDLEFLTEMIPHHAGALIMASMVSNGTPRAQVATLAANITSSQSAEIAEIQELRQAMGTP